MEGTSSWRRGPIIVSALILLAVCIVLWIILEPKCLAAVAAQPSSLLPLPFLVFVAFEMLVILQHLSRILTAKLVGLKLLAFACGPFAIRRIRNRTRFTWNNRETMISGTTVFEPKTMAGSPVAMSLANCQRSSVNDSGRVVFHAACSSQ